MEELIFFIVFTVWYTGALIVSERIGKKSRLGEEWTFFLSFLLTPIIGAGIAFLIRSK